MSVYLRSMQMHRLHTYKQVLMEGRVVSFYDNKFSNQTTYPYGAPLMRVTEFVHSR